MSRTLSERRRDELIPQPIVFVQDRNGTHFATEQLPWRTVIDVRAGVMFPGVTIHEASGTVTISLDGRTVRYVQRGVGLLGEWICDLERQ
jgi:hypothetical protein